MSRTNRTGIPIHPAKPKNSSIIESAARKSGALIIARIICNAAWMATEIEMKTQERSCSRARNNTVAVALTHIVFETRLNSLETTEGRLMVLGRVTVRGKRGKKRNKFNELWIMKIGDRPPLLNALSLSLSLFLSRVPILVWLSRACEVWFGRVPMNRNDSNAK